MVLFPGQRLAQGWTEGLSSLKGATNQMKEPQEDTRSAMNHECEKVHIYEGSEITKSTGHSQDCHSTVHCRWCVSVIGLVSRCVVSLVISVVGL